MALRLIGSFYLQNQPQRVFPGSTKPDYLTTNEGFVLGPFLFCLYVNRLKHRLNEDFTLGISHIFYADDLQVYIPVLIDQSRLKALNLPGVTLRPTTVVPFDDEVKNLGVMLNSK